MHRGSGKLRDKIALITGGDSGIGQAFAIAFGKEDADGVVGNEEFCQEAVAQAVKEISKIDILVNNADEQHLQDSIEKITEKQLERAFWTNIFQCF